jgi:hypothetical protein
MFIYQNSLPKQQSVIKNLKNTLAEILCRKQRKEHVFHIQLNLRPLQSCDTILCCNANIYFNKTCLKQNITPKYAQIHIKTANTLEAAKHTETQTRTLRVKNEIKFLYKKKQHLNKQLYDLHIQNANEWGNIWNIITNETTPVLH